MPKLNWLFSLIACAGISSVALPAKGQALLPYIPKLDSEKLELQGLQLLQDAVQLIRFQQYELALPRAELATQLAPANYEVWIILGSLYLQQDKIDEGVKVLEKAETLAPEQEGLLFSLGNAYFQQGKYEAAKEKLEAGLEIEENSPEALFDLGNTYLKLAKLDKAIDSYEEAFELENGFWPALNNIGLVKYEQGEVEDAIATWEAVLEVDDAQAEPQLALAVAFFTQGDIKKGMELAETALALDNRYADLEFLRENLWGERLLEDTKKFLNTPQMQDIVARYQEKTSITEANPSPQSEINQ